MRLEPFALERYFAKHEFSAPYLLCSSDSESVALKDLLALEPDAREKLDALWLGYTESKGAPTLRDAIATWYTEASPDQILVHAGAEEAIFGFAHAMLSPGDRVVVQWPCYQSVAEIPRALGCQVVRWEGPVELLPARGAKAIFVNSPHNPTGRHFSKAEFETIVAVARKEGAILFSDEVYRGLAYRPEEELPAGADVYENAVSLGVMSKSLGLPGLRIGWIATRNREIYDRMATFKDYTTICNSAPSEFLATLALRHREKLIGRNRELAMKHLPLLEDFFRRHEAKFAWERPGAGCITFPRLREGDADRFAEAVLAKSGVLVAPGSTFGTEAPHFRIGFGRKNFPEVLERFERALSDLSD